MHAVNRRQGRMRGRVVDGVLTFDAKVAGQIPKGVSFYAPRGRSPDEIRGKIRRGDTNELVDVEHKTMAECLDAYFQHREATMAEPDGIGMLPVRRVRVVHQVFIGKETNEVMEEIQDESGGVVTYAEGYRQTSLASALKHCTDSELVKATRLPKQTIRDIRKGATPRAGTVRKLFDGLQALEDEKFQASKASRSQSKPLRRRRR